MRIGIEARHAPYGINDFHRVASCKRKVVEGLRQSGIQVGAVPTEWRFSLEEIPAELWKGIEVWNGSDTWVPVGLNLSV